MRSLKSAQQEQSDPNSENDDDLSSKQTNLHNNDQSDLSQEEIDKIVNDHILTQENIKQAPTPALENTQGISKP